MGEIKAGIFTMAIFALLIFPTLLIVGVESLHQHSFMKHTTEMSELVRLDGGMKDRAGRTAKEGLVQREYTIVITRENGQRYYMRDERVNKPADYQRDPAITTAISGASNITNSPNLKFNYGETVRIEYFYEYDSPLKQLFTRDRSKGLNHTLVEVSNFRR